MKIFINDLKIAFLLFISAVLIAFFYNHISPAGIAVFGQWQSSKGVVTAISKKEPVNVSIEINNPETIKTIVQNKSRIIIDVRQSEIFDEGHLPGALSFPLMDFDEIIEKVLNTVNKRSAILVYCSSFECTDSHTFANHLQDLKYADVKVFSGGFRQWQEMGYDIEKKEQ